MNLSQKELRELARFFAKRYPEPIDRHGLGAAVGIVVSDAPNALLGWMDVIESAQQRGLLKKLCRVAASRAPEDDNLQEISTLLNGRRHQLLWATAAVAATLLLGIGVSVIGGIGGSAVANGPHTAGLTAESLVDEGSESTTFSTQAQQPLPAPAAVVASLEDSASTVGMTEVMSPPEAVTPPTPTVESQPDYSRLLPNGRCDTASGELIGYWYAGRDAPGVSGQAITVPMSVNVRNDYPDRHSGFNKRAPIRCVLHKGDQLTLSAEPILVPGDRYWVPIYGGDLR